LVVFQGKESMQRKGIIENFKKSRREVQLETIFPRRFLGTCSWSVGTRDALRKPSKGLKDRDRRKIEWVIWEKEKGTWKG